MIRPRPRTRVELETPFSTSRPSAEGKNRKKKGVEPVIEAERTRCLPLAAGIGAGQRWTCPQKPGAQLWPGIDICGGHQRVEALREVCLSCCCLGRFLRYQPSFGCPPPRTSGWDAGPMVRKQANGAILGGGQREDWAIGRWFCPRPVVANDGPSRASTTDPLGPMPPSREETLNFMIPSVC